MDVAATLFLSTRQEFEKNPWKIERIGLIGWGQHTQHILGAQNQIDVEH
jgi:hypothetical protein